MNLDEDSDIVIEDMENYRTPTDKVFSHESLVMSATRKCLENGAKEMRTGYWNEKMDKNGNTIRTYIEDTRKAFIESVETLIMIMYCDLDPATMKSIEEIKSKLNEIYKELCNDEMIDWQNSNIQVKNKRWSLGIAYKTGCLNTSLPYYQEYIDEEVKSYREIFKSLTIMSKKLDFYAAEVSGSA